MGFTRRQYGPQRYNMPRDELEAAMAYIQETIDRKPDGRKSFLVLHGPPGAGKTWLLEQIREQCGQKDVRCATIVNAKEMVASPEAQLITLLRWCLQDPTATVADAAETEIVQDLSNRLDEALRRQDRPIALFFDDLDYWLKWLPPTDPPETIDNQKQRNERFLRVYRQLWWVVLRHTGLPGLIICTSREPLTPRSFNAALNRKLALVEVERLPDEEKINHLVDGILQERTSLSANPKLRDLTQRYACGYPLVVDWLAWKLSQDQYVFEDTKRAENLRELAGVIVDGRLDADDEELLIDLARNFPDGFSDEHAALGSRGPGLIRLLSQVGLVGLIPGTSTYQVLPPLACLYREGSNG